MAKRAEIRPKLDKSMELNEKQANERLASPNNLANRLAEFRRERKLQLDEQTSTLTVNPGRNLPRLPVEVRSEIADRLLSGEVTTKQIAEEYAVSKATVSRIKTQAEKIEREDRQIEEKHREHTRDRFLEQTIKDEASKKMLLAMGLITEEKLEKLKATELAKVSSSMAQVAGVFQPKAAQAPQINLVVYSPEVRSEETFSVVEIASNATRPSFSE